MYTVYSKGDNDMETKQHSEYLEPQELLNVLSEARKSGARNFCMFVIGTIMGCGRKKSAILRWQTYVME